MTNKMEDAVLVMHQKYLLEQIEYFKTQYDKHPIEDIEIAYNDGIADTLEAVEEMIKNSIDGLQSLVIDKWADNFIVEALKPSEMSEAEFKKQYIGEWKVEPEGK